MSVLFETIQPQPADGGTNRNRPLSVWLSEAEFKGVKRLAELGGFHGLDVGGSLQPGRLGMGAQFARALRAGLARANGLNDESRATVSEVIRLADMGLGVKATRANSAGKPDRPTAAATAAPPVNASYVYRAPREDG